MVVAAPAGDKRRRFVIFSGNGGKVVRRALERRVAAGFWRDAIDDLDEASLPKLTGKPEDAFNLRCSRALAQGASFVWRDLLTGVHWTDSGLTTNCSLYDARYPAVVSGVPQVLNRWPAYASLT